MITTIAGTGPGFSGDGGPAIQAQLSYPSGVAVDGQGNVYIADAWNHWVRRVGPDGIISTIAGTRPGSGEGGFPGDGGLTTRLNYPTGVAVDDRGNIYVADRDNHRILRVVPGRAITTFSGTGERGFSGDGGSAVQAQLNLPSGVAVDLQGNVYIADTGNNRIRRIERELIDGSSADFDGNGAVDFGDFFALAGAFGGTDARFDLDGDGAVGFGDFFAFAAEFGKKTRK